jgi:Protein of unknown function (DUF1697)
VPKAPTKTAYVLLFRGVGGATQLPTAPLREALTGAGFENVATYSEKGRARTGAGAVVTGQEMEDGRCYGT